MSDPFSSSSFSSSDDNDTNTSNNVFDIGENAQEVTPLTSSSPPVENKESKVRENKEMNPNWSLTMGDTVESKYSSPPVSSQTFDPIPTTSSSSSSSSSASSDNKNNNNSHHSHTEDISPSVHPSTSPLSFPPSSTSPPLSSTHNTTFANSPPNETNDEDDDDYDKTEPTDAESSESASSVFSRPLLYYKRTAQRDSQQNRSQSDAVLSSNPVEVVLPSGSIALGFPAKKSGVEGTNSAGGDDADGNVNANGNGNVPNDRLFRHMVVFSLPTDEQLGRSRFLQCLLFSLLPCDFGLVTALYTDPDIATNTTYSDGYYSQLAFGLTMLEYALIILAVIFGSTRGMTIFIVCFYIDSILNLIREYSILQFVHFLLQLMIGHVVSGLKQSLSPSWFAPAN